jgi:Meiotically Up-regulated Gene 113 (MUG113) protein
MSMSDLAWAWKLRLQPKAKLVLIGLADGFRSATALAEWAGIAEVELDLVLASLAVLPEFSLTREGGHLVPSFPVIEREPASQARAPIKGVIYVLRSQAGTKIGISSHSGQKRAIELSRASGMRVMFVWETRGPMEQMRAVERTVMVVLDDHRLIGEWFKIAPDEAIALIKNELATPGVTSK